MGFFGQDQAFDLMIFSEIAEGDPEKPETEAARDILGLPRADRRPAENTLPGDGRHHQKMDGSKKRLGRYSFTARSLF